VQLVVNYWCNESHKFEATIDETTTSSTRIA
jgi:hypothetical protein